MRSGHAILLALAFSCAGSCLLAQENILPLVARGSEIEIDPVVLRLLTSPDATFIKLLHDRSERKLLANLGIETDNNGLAVDRFQRKALVFRREYEVGGERRHVLVYDPCLHSWPGCQPETIIVCDAFYRPLDWKEVGGSPMFQSAALDTSAGSGPVLLITRRHRHTNSNPERGIYRFSLANDQIKAAPKTEWLYKDDAERAHYAQ